MRHPTTYLLLLFSLNGFAQSPSSDVLSQLSTDWFELNTEITLSADGFIANHMDQIGLGSGDDLQLLRKDTDAFGITHTRMQQYHKGVPVEAAHIIFHEKDGLLKTVNGNPVQNLTLGVIPGITPEEALESAFNYTNAQHYIWGKNINNSRYPDSKLVIAQEQFNRKAADYSLMYKVSIFSVKPLAYDHYFIDAHTGELSFILQGDHHSDASGVAVTRYSGTRTMITDSLGPNHYELHATGTPNEILTLNVNEGYNSTTLTPFIDSNNNWNNTNTKMDEVAADVHWGTQATMEFYLNRYNWNVNGGLPVENWVHFNHKMANAAYMNGIFVYGDGDQVNTGPYTSLDIVAHELTHSVIHHSSGLIYYGESGSLNESFCDIFGVALRFARDSSNADYIIGEQCHFHGQPLRSLKNPGLNQQPNTYQGNNWLWASQYHNNNGVPNYCYYLLSEGGTGINDNGFNYSVQGIGHRKAELIAFHNLAFYLTPTSDFYDARMGSILAAEGIYGTCSPEVSATAKAWEAVGVGQAISSQDLALLEVSAPQTSCVLSANESFSFLVQNFGCTDTFSAGDTISLYYIFDQQPPVEVHHVLSLALAPGDNILIKDTLIYDLSTPGSWPLRAWLQVPSDQDSDNDSIYIEITNYGANRQYDLELNSIDPRNSGCQATIPQVPTFYIFSKSCTPIPAGDTVYAGIRIFTDAGYSQTYIDTIVLNRILRYEDRLWETDPLAPAVSGLYGQQSKIESWVYYPQDADHSNDTVPARPFYKPYTIDKNNPKVYHNLENEATSLDSMHLFDHRNFYIGGFNQNTARVDFRSGTGVKGSQALHFSGEQEWFEDSDTSIYKGIYTMHNEKGNSSVCFCLDNTNWPTDSLYLEFDLRQTASLMWPYYKTGLPLSTSKFWITNGTTRVSDYFFPSTHTMDGFTHHKIDLTPYIGVQEICFKAMNFISHHLDTAAGSLGDNVYLDNIYFHPGVNYTGMNEMSLTENLSLYPNPSHGQVWIKYKSTDPSVLKVQVINSAGVNLMERVYHAEAGSQSFELSIKNFPPGIYLFRVHSGREVVTEKILLK